MTANRNTKRLFLLVVLGERVGRFARGKWSRLGDKRMRRFRLLGYSLGSILATYSIVDAFYDLNIDIFDAVNIPFWEFYRQQIVPFLAEPLRWVGLDLGSLYESVVPLSGVGASIWANAEFRKNRYLFLHPFPKLQRRPGYFDPNFDWTRAPKAQEPPRLLSIRSVLRVPEIILLTYSLMGLVCSLFGLVVGVRFLARYVFEILLFFAEASAYIVRHFLAPLERWGDDNHSGTRIFLAAYDFHARLEQNLHERLHRRRMILLSERESIKPLLRDILSEAGRVSSLVLVLLAIVVLWIR